MRYLINFITCQSAGVSDFFLCIFFGLNRLIFSYTNYKNVLQIKFYYNYNNYFFQFSDVKLPNRLVDGTFNEEESALTFQEALTAWRNGSNEKNLKGYLFFGKK